MLLTLVVASSVLGTSKPAAAQVYSWRDADGRVVLSNTERSGADQLVKSSPVSEPARPLVQASPVSEPATPLAKAASLTPVQADRAKMYEELIAEHARLNDIRPDLVRAVVQVESRFNPYARSPKGAQGLMQLMPGTAGQLGVKNPYSPEENIRAGVAYLRQLLDRYDNDEQLALAAYNAGPEAVDKYGQSIPPYRETRSYVAQINGLSARPVARRNATIYKVTETVNGRETTRYTDKRPTSGTYEVVGRR